MRPGPPGRSSTGAQPAEALPDSTLGYVSIDLDPSGEQKIEALRTLKKFPAFEDEVGLDTDDDIREKIFEELDPTSAAPASTTGTTSSRGWATGRGGRRGHRRGRPRRRSSCSRSRTRTRPTTGSPSSGLRRRAATTAAAGSIDDDWALIAETDEIAEGVADDAAEAPLSEDEDFKQWTDEAGDAGIVTMYAAPAAGEYLADRRRACSAWDCAGPRTARQLRLDPRRPRHRRPATTSTA